MTAQESETLPLNRRSSDICRGLDNFNGTQCCILHLTEKKHKFVVSSEWLAFES